MEKREHSCAVGGNVNWYSYYGRRYGDSLKKLEIKPPYDPAIPFLGIYPEEAKFEKPQGAKQKKQKDGVYHLRIDSTL